MSNIYIASNANVECESFLRQATTGVVYALAPMEIVAGLAPFNIPFADASRSTATCNADIAGNVMSRDEVIEHGCISIHAVFCLRSLCDGSSGFRECHHRWIVGDWFLLLF